MRAAPALPVPAPLDTPSNTKGGVLVVLPPGYGPAPGAPASDRSFFSDAAVNRGKVIARFLSWFPLWGIPLQTSRMSAGDFERSFYCLEWPAAPVTGASGPQLVPKYAARMPELAEAILSRTPRLIIFLSCYLWQAVNTCEGKALIAQALGAPLDGGRRISQMRLAAYVQRWEKALAIALPLPGPNTTAAFVQSVAPAVQQAFRQSGLLPARSLDPLLEPAAGCLVIDWEASVRKIRTELNVPEERARSLLLELEKRMCKADPSGDLRLMRTER